MANVSPCNTPATISKKLLSPLGDLTMNLVFIYDIIIALTVSSGRPYILSMSLIFPLCMLSKAFEKSINNNIAESCFDFATSIILRIVKICPVVDLFCLKPFWFLSSTGSNTGHILFSNIRL